MTASYRNVTTMYDIVLFELLENLLKLELLQLYQHIYATTYTTIKSLDMKKR